MSSQLNCDVIKCSTAGRWDLFIWIQVTFSNQTGWDRFTVCGVSDKVQHLPLTLVSVETDGDVWRRKIPPQISYKYMNLSTSHSPELADTRTHVSLLLTQCMLGVASSVRATHPAADQFDQFWISADYITASFQSCDELLEVFPPRRLTLKQKMADITCWRGLLRQLLLHRLTFLWHSH